MSVYRESPPGMPEPPRRGDWQESCPHGFLASWQWCCPRCKGEVTSRLVISSWYVSMVWGGIVLSLAYLLTR